MPGFFSTQMPSLRATAPAFDVIRDVTNALPIAQRVLPFAIAWDRMSGITKMATVTGLIVGPSMLGASLSIAVGKRYPVFRRKSLAIGIAVSALTAGIVWWSLKRARVLHLV